MAKIKYHIFGACELCGDRAVFYPAFQKWLCPKHARLEFLKYAAKLLGKASATVFIIGVLVYFFL